MRRDWCALLPGRLLSLPLFLALVAGCPVLPGADDSNDDALDPNEDETVAANTAPVAAAGEDQSVVAGDLVVLDGASSADADNDRLLYFWQPLITSDDIVLQDPYSSHPRFTAPSVTAPTVFTFRLTVIDGFAFAADEVAITVAPE